MKIKANIQLCTKHKRDTQHVQKCHSAEVFIYIVIMNTIRYRMTMLILITKYKAVDTLRSLYDHSCLLSSNTAQVTSISVRHCARGLVKVSMHMIFTTKD